MLDSIVVISVPIRRRRARGTSMAQNKEGRSRRARSFHVSARNDHAQGDPRDASTDGTRSPRTVASSLVATLVTQRLDSALHADGPERYRCARTSMRAPLCFDVTPALTFTSRYRQTPITIWHE